MDYQATKQGIENLLKDVLAKQGLSVIYSKLKPFECGDAHYWHKANDKVLLNDNEQNSLLRLSRFFEGSRVSTCTTEVGLYGENLQRAVNIVMAICSLKPEGERQFSFAVTQSGSKLLNALNYPVADFITDMAVIYGVATAPVKNDNGNAKLDFSALAPEAYRSFEIFVDSLHKALGAGGVSLNGLK